MAADAATDRVVTDRAETNTAIDVDVALSLPAQVTAAAVARRFVTATLRRWKSPQDVDDALIVATELVQNVLEHTDDGGELRLRCAPGTLIIEVSDTSQQLPRIIEEDYVGCRGRGMRMVQLIASRWGVRRAAGGKVVWVEIAASAI